MCFFCFGCFRCCSYSFYSPVVGGAVIGGFRLLKKYWIDITNSHNTATPISPTDCNLLLSY